MIAPLPSPPLWTHIAQTAADLFYKHGLHAVGVDRVAAAAGVTKRTLYRYFPSKDALIAAALRRSPIVRFPEEGDPCERILGAFKAVEAFLESAAYRGCPYIFYSAELTERTHPARLVIERRLAKRLDWFRKRAVEAGFADPATVAERLDVVFDGALASGAKRGERTPVKAATDLAALILRDAAMLTAPAAALAAAR